MEFTDPFSFRRLFNLSMSYGGVVFLILCLGPLKPLLEAPITPELLREAAGGIGALLPVGMGISAVVAGVVRKLLFRYGGVNKASLWAIFLVGSFWQLPLSLGIASAAAEHEPGVWMLPLYFTAGAMLAAAILVAVLYKGFPQSRM
ncbi:MAG: hypothetical protein IKY92_06270 [Akkermansia sp.]|nr:hypothetical protein [Akkermansia sp.]